MDYSEEKMRAAFDFCRNLMLMTVDALCHWSEKNDLDSVALIGAYADTFHNRVHKALDEAEKEEAET